VPPTPLNHSRHLLSPIRRETPSHGYTLHSTPERIKALDREGSQGDGFGWAVAGGGVARTVAGSGGDVTGSGGGRVAGRGVVGGAGVMENVVGQERLQQELLGVMLGGQLLEAQLEVVLVLGLEEVALDEQWRDPHPLTSEF
jgi:hypothetical protein